MDVKKNESVEIFVDLGKRLDDLSKGKPSDFVKALVEAKALKQWNDEGNLALMKDDIDDYLSQVITSIEAKIVSTMPKPASPKRGLPPRVTYQNKYYTYKFVDSAEQLPQVMLQHLSKSVDVPIGSNGSVLRDKVSEVLGIPSRQIQNLLTTDNPNTDLQDWHTVTDDEVVNQTHPAGQFLFVDLVKYTPPISDGKSGYTGVFTYLDTQADAIAALKFNNPSLRDKHFVLGIEGKAANPNLPFIELLRQSDLIPDRTKRRIDVIYTTPVVTRPASPKSESKAVRKIYTFSVNNFGGPRGMNVPLPEGSTARDAIDYISKKIGIPSDAIKILHRKPARDLMYKDGYEILEKARSLGLKYYVVNRESKTGLNDEYVWIPYSETEIIATGVKNEDALDLKITVDDSPEFGYDDDNFIITATDLHTGKTEKIEIPRDFEISTLRNELATKFNLDPHNTSVRDLQFKRYPVIFSSNRSNEPEWISFEHRDRLRPPSRYVEIRFTSVPTT